MTPPRCSADTDFAALVQRLPLDTSTLDRLARDHGAFRRARAIQSPQQLLRILLLYAAADCSLRLVALLHTLLVAPITDEAVRQRLHASQAFLAALLHHCWTPPPPDTTNRRVLLVDSSGISGPGARGHHLRLHLALNLHTLAIEQAHTTFRDQGDALSVFAFQPGDLVLHDAAYSHAQPLIDLQQQGVEVLGRFNPWICHGRFQASGQRWKGHHTDTLWWQHVKGLAPGEHRVFAVELLDGDGQPYPAWVHALGLPTTQANQRRREYRRRCRKAKKGPRKSSLALKGVGLLLTTTPPWVATGSVLWDWYRRRWQIELAFKRFKSVLGFKQLRTRGRSGLGLVWLQGKLLYAVLLEGIGRSWGLVWHTRGPRTHTPWRAVQLAHAWCLPQVLGVAHWPAQPGTVLQQKLPERQRKRTLQPLGVDILEHLAEAALAA